MSVLRRPALLALLVLVATGCGGTASPAQPTPDPTSPASSTPSPADAEGRLIGRGTVIDDGSGPRLCFQVLRSYPPQCGGGVQLVIWRWPDEGVERSAKVTWGDFAVVGTYDGRRFTTAKTVEPASPARADAPDPNLASPCPEPAGGWRAPEPERATYQTQERAARLAMRLPDYGDIWIDDRGDQAQIPTAIVLNVSVTEDLPGAEQALRRVWGGALCVSRAERTHAELAKIRGELSDTPRLLGSGVGFGHVDLTVVHDDGTLQQTLDRRYSKGLVRVGSALKPYSQ